VAELLGCVAEQPLVDHHCHGVLVRDADEATLESMLNEGAAPNLTTGAGGSMFDSQAGFAFRRVCPPVLGLPPHAELPDYVARRAEHGADEVSKRFLALAGTSVMCVDTGYVPEPITSPTELGDLAGAVTHEQLSEDSAVSLGAVMRVALSAHLGELSASFDIARDGHPTNVQVEQSSGVPSLDQSAVRAVQRIDTFGPLPQDYPKNKVSVEFWFDYTKK